MRQFVFLFLLLSINGLAQKITLTAKLQDRITNEPLPFASIGLKTKSISTVSNLQGEFDFHIPEEFRNEILVISMLGYEKFEAPVWSLVDKADPVILMDKSTTVLAEIVVFDSLTGGEILRNAWNRIPDNFPMKSFMLDGFYRDVKKVGGSYISMLEAAVKIYDDDYKEPRNKSRLRERVKLIEVRKSLGYENKFTQYFGQQNLLEDLLLHNTIRYRQIDVKDEFYELMKREPDSYYNGHEVFVIVNDQDYKLKVFVDKVDYSIIRLDYEIETQGEQIDERKGLISKFYGYKKTIDFKRFEAKMYLNYITVTSTEKWYEEKSNILKFETELIQHLLINEVHTQNQQRIGSTEKMRNYGLQYQDYPYNKAFWENYNVIKETPIDREIQMDLERNAPLEKQFEDN